MSVCNANIALHPNHVGYESIHVCEAGCQVRHQMVLIVLDYALYWNWAYTCEHWSIARCRRGKVKGLFCQWIVKSNKCTLYKTIHSIAHFSEQMNSAPSFRVQFWNTVKIVHNFAPTNRNRKQRKSRNHTANSTLTHNMCLALLAPLLFNHTLRFV